MMKEMKKDEQIEQTFREYFAGGELPQVDLDAAKAELKAAARRRARRKRGIVSAILSACACLLVVALTVGLLPRSGFSASPQDPNGAEAPGQSPGFNPSGEADPQIYSLSDVRMQPIDYSEFSSLGGDAVSAFELFSSSRNATAEYSVYYKGDDAVLLCARVGLISGTYRVRARVYLDLSEGKSAAQELLPYRSLKEEKGYRGETEYLNGEYVTRAYAERKDREWYFDAVSQNEDGFALIAEILLDL